MDNVTNPKAIYNTLFRLDLSKSYKNNNALIETSFSFYHWKLAEALANPEDTRLDLTLLSPLEVKTMVLNVFPMDRICFTSCVMI